MKAWVWRTAAIGSVAAASIAAAQPPATPAERWLAFASDREGDYFYDQASVVRSGDDVSYRLRARFKAATDASVAAILVVDMDCRAQSTSDLSYTLYDRDGAAIRDFAVPEGRREVRGIMPGSPEETLYRSLCPERLVRPIAAPPMMTTIQVAPPPVMAVPMAPPAPPVPPIAYPPPPSPPPHLRSRAEWLRPPSALITEDDYPAAALRNEEQGAVTVRLAIARDGRVSACTIVGSSGSVILDAATCRLFTARARFTPARDRRGRTATDQKVTRIVWRIPDDPPPAPAFDPAAPPPPPEAGQSAEQS